MSGGELLFSEIRRHVYTYVIILNFDSSLDDPIAFHSRYPFFTVV